MAGRPTKPLALVQGHRTKAEKQVRAQAETKLLTGCQMKENPEVKANRVAHKEFRRLKKLLKTIDKDDDLFGHAINTHCTLVGEIAWLDETKQRLQSDLDKTENMLEVSAKASEDFEAYYSARESISKLIFSCDDKIMKKRKMSNDIGRENLLTIQSALRSIPKKAPKKEQSALGSMLANRQVK